MNRFAIPVVLTFLGMLIASYCSPSDVRAGTITVRLPTGTYIRKEVTSLREARYENVVPQKYDLSCGAASLATILKYYYKDDVTEPEIIKYMIKHGDKQQIADKGFSLLDLKRYVEHENYLAAGYKEVPIDKLKKLKIPGIVLVESGKYAHFVVLKGMREDTIFIADPAFGNRSISRAAFAESWNKVIFLVVSNTKKTLAEVPLSTVASAPEMDVIRIRQLGAGGFSSFPTSGEF